MMGTLEGPPFPASNQDISQDRDYKPVPADSRILPHASRKALPYRLGERADFSLRA